MRILRGNDINIKWTIKRDTGGLYSDENFSNSILTVYWVDSQGKRAVEHTVSGNVISVHIGGEIQRLGNCYLDAYWQNKITKAWSRTKINNVIEFVDNPESVDYKNLPEDIDVITLGFVSNTFFGGSYIANFDNYYNKTEINQLFLDNRVDLSPYYTKKEVDILIESVKNNNGGEGGGGTTSGPFELINGLWTSKEKIDVKALSINGEDVNMAAFTAWQIDAEGNVYTNRNVYSTKSLSAKGLSVGGSGGGSGGGGASTLGQLMNVGPWADNIPSKTRLMVQLAGASFWTSSDLESILGSVDTKIAAAIAPVDFRITKHINDDNVHVTADEQLKWNTIASWFAEDVENNAIYLTAKADGTNRGLYSNSFLSAKGITNGTGGGGGGMDEMLLWNILGNSGDEQISYSHVKTAITTGLSGYATQSWVNDVALNNYIHKNKIGVANGIVPLDSNKRISSVYLPSYVDDVLEFASLSTFPSTGESGLLYITLDTNLAYRWSGTQYIEISKSLALGETDSTAFSGNRGKALEESVKTINSYNDKTIWGNKFNVVGNIGGTIIPLVKDVHDLGTNEMKFKDAYLKYGIKIGDIWLVHDVTNNAIKVCQMTTNGIESPANFYALGGISAKGFSPGGSSNATRLSELLDVTITSPANRQALVYDSATSKWINGSAGLTDFTVKVGNTPYSSVNGIVSLPAYPTYDLSHYLPLTGGSISGKLYIRTTVGNEALNVNGYISTHGTTGWINTTYGGGVFMQDDQWVKVYGGKKFNVNNTLTHAINCAGGYYSSLNTNHDNIWNNKLYSAYAVFNVEPVIVPSNTFQNIIGWTSTIDGLGYVTRYSIGSSRWTDWGALELNIGNSDGGDSGHTLSLSGNGNAVWTGNFTAQRISLGADANEPNSITCANWFRSTGNTGWYNETYMGGFHMVDNIYLRTSHAKAFYVDNATYYSVNTLGGYYRSGDSGYSWGNGKGALNVEIYNNNAQTPLIVAARNTNGFLNNSTDRVFAIELVNTGSEVRFNFGTRIDLFSFNSSGSLTVAGSIIVNEAVYAYRGVNGYGSGNSYNASGVMAWGNGTDAVKPVYGFHQPGIYAGTLVQDNGDMFSFRDQGGNYNNLSVNSLIAYGAVSAKQVSDQRFKINAKSFTDANEFLLSLGEVQTYEYNEAGLNRTTAYATKGTHIGLFHHNVEKRLPSMAFRDDDGYGGLNYLDTDYINLIAAATQQTYKLAKDNRSRIKKLEDEVNRLKIENDKLNKLLKAA